MTRLLFGETPDEKGKKVRDSLSAIEILDQGKTLFLATDEAVGGIPSLERLRLTGPDTYSSHTRLPLSDFIELPSPPNKKGEVEEVDLEGLAHHQGYLWFVGSHSTRRRKPRSEGEKGISDLSGVENSKNRALLGRIPLVDGPDGMTLARKENGRKAAVLAHDLREVLREDSLLGPFLRPFRNGKGKKVVLPGKDNGFDVEGIAVVSGERETSRIFVGLRGPVLRGFAMIVELSVRDADNGPRLELLPVDGEKLYRRHLLGLEGLGIRDLCVVGQDLFILAGPTMTLAAPILLLRWRGFAATEGETLLELTPGKLEKIGALPSRLGSDNAEGLACVVDEEASAEAQSAELMAVYDSPTGERLDGDFGSRADSLTVPLY